MLVMSLSVSNKNQHFFRTYIIFAAKIRYYIEIAKKKLNFLLEKFSFY